MGYTRHNAIVVTCGGYDEAHDMLAQVHNRAVELFGALVSAPIDAVINSHRSFFVAPDGSKEGWDLSDDYDRKRQELMGFIDSLAYGDGSNAIQFVEVAYDDQGEVSIDRTNRDREEAETHG